MNIRPAPIVLFFVIAAAAAISATLPVDAGPAGAAVKSRHAHALSHRMTLKARAEALNVLFTQLKTAPDEESAEQLASAIEKIWRRSGSDTADLMMERAGVALQEQNYDLAIQILDALTRIAPAYAEGWNQLATVHFLRDDYKGAVRELRHVLALEPRHFKALEGLAIILRETGNKKSALKAMRQVLAIHPQMKSAKQAEEELAREVEGQNL
jgi:tetratricopeptide (TPR) repeat protein